MYLPKEKILFNSQFRKELEDLLEYAEKALKNRKNVWSHFISAQVAEEVKTKTRSLLEGDNNVVSE